MDQENNKGVARQVSIDQYFEILERNYIKEFDCSETWGLEVLKTLFLLNSVGLTGTFALAATPDLQVTPSLFLYFALGIVLAVLSMTLGRYMHSRAAHGWLDVMNRAQTLGETSLQLRNLPTVKCLQIGSHACAFLSAAACIWAGYRLYVAL